MRREWKPLALMASIFLAIYYLPVGTLRFDQALVESFQLVKWYAREHVLLCLIPAFFIAGGISVFVSQASVMRYLGPGAPKVPAFAVASVSGGILAVCSCTILPLFAGIYRMGAGLGPATAFLYAGPAINVLAIILTGRILGLELGLARAVGAIVFSVVIGLLMQLFFKDEEKQKLAQTLPTESDQHLGRTVLRFAGLTGILIFATWGAPTSAGGLWQLIFGLKWYAVGVFALMLAAAILWPPRPNADQEGAWVAASWGYTKQILPLLLAGVLVAGLLLGRPGHEGLIPSGWIAAAVGGNSLGANLFAAVSGAFMYFATLTEVPILQGLLGAGMGQGPALSLLLAGPAVSLPSILVLRSIMGVKKTAVFIVLVIIMSSLTGLIFGLVSG